MQITQGIEMRNAVNLLDAFEASRLDIANQVAKATGRAALQAARREKMNLLTTVEFLDSGAVKLTQLHDVVTLTRGQAEELAGRILGQGCAS